MPSTQVASDTREHVAALLKLSNFADDVAPSDIESLVKDAPDPETVIQAFFNKIPMPDSTALRRKWRKTLTSVWKEQNPKASGLPDLPFTADQATSSFHVLDAAKYLQQVFEKPLRFTQSSSGELSIVPRDFKRIAGQLPSYADQNLDVLKSEQEAPELVRLRALLQAARLLRPYQGQLIVVQSRFLRFFELPIVHQFYVLWHAEMYHLNWSMFAGHWDAYVHTIQEYLPLFWDLNESAAEGVTFDKHVWLLRLAAAFAPLWGNIGISPMHQYTLPAAFDRLLVHDILARYGLVNFTPSGDFTWTALGEAIIHAEHKQNLPCHLDIFR